MIDPNDVTVRFFEELDLDDFCDYWFRSPPSFWETRPILLSSFGTEEETRQRMLTRIAENATSRPLTVLYKGERVGVHGGTHFVENESLIMHAHFFFQKFRGQGIGTISYVKAMEKFLKELNLKKIIFKTPIQTAAPLRIKEKLGLKALREEVLDWPQLRPGTRALVFEVTPADMPFLKNKVGIVG